MPARSDLTLLVVWLASSCTTIAGLDGDYQLGAGAGGASAQAAASNATNNSSASESSVSTVSTGGTSGTGGDGSGGVGGSHTPVCGDGNIDSGEECDDGQGSPSPYCDNCDVICTGNFEVEDPQSHHCYYDTVGDGMHFSWQAGRTWCQNTFQGDLVVISDSAELSFVQSLAPNVYDEDRWIGANDSATNGTFEWVNGEAWLYTNGNPPWDSGEPGPTLSDECVVLQSDGSLAEVSCSQGLTHHMCERVPEGS